jgi:hypothetical protein
MLTICETSGVDASLYCPQEVVPTSCYHKGSTCQSIKWYCEQYLLSVKDHVNSPALGSRYFPTFGGEGVDDFGLSFFRYDSPSITK